MNAHITFCFKCLNTEKYIVNIRCDSTHLDTKVQKLRVQVSLGQTARPVKKEEEEEEEGEGKFETQTTSQ